MDKQPHSPVDTDEQYISLQEAAEILALSEDAIRQMVKKGELEPHTVAGAFLRFKRADINYLKMKARIRSELFPQKGATLAYNAKMITASFFEKLKDFWYFNDFYIFCTLAILVLLYFIVSTQ